MNLLLPQSRWLLLLLLLAGCRSEQEMFQLPEVKWQAVSVVEKEVNAPDSLGDVVSSYPAVVAAATASVATTRAGKRAKTVPSLARRPGLLHPSITRTTAVAARAPRKAEQARRHPQDETEGNPWLLTLGVVLVAAGIVAGLVIGGGLGVVVGVVVGLAGYYFFTKGLLGPNAWLEVVQELFQL